MLMNSIKYLFIFIIVFSDIVFSFYWLYEVIYLKFGLFFTE